MFNWNDLKTFLAVAREGSALGAARALGVNQTTVARRIEALEESLGLKLFERDVAGSRLTDAGQDLLSEAARMEEAADSFWHRAAGHRRGVAGILRVTATEMLANAAITPALPAFKATYPGLVVELAVTDRPLDLAAGEADIALRADEVVSDDLVGRRVAEFPQALYASRDYLLARGLPESIEDLRDHDLVVGDGVNAPLPGVTWMLAQVPGAQPVVRSNSLSQMLQTLKAGMGIGPFGCLAADLEPELIRCTPPIPEAAAVTWVVTRREIKDTARVRAFLDFFIPHFLVLQRSLRERGEAAHLAKLAELRAALAARDGG